MTAIPGQSAYPVHLPKKKLYLPTLQKAVGHPLRPKNRSAILQAYEQEEAAYEQEEGKRAPPQNADVFALCCLSS